MPSLNEPNGTDDPHDPRREIERQDNLVLLAMGEPAPAEFERHQSGCVQCRYDLEAFRHTVQLGREMSEHRPELDARLPASIWSGIAEQIGLPDRVADPRPDQDVPARRPVRLAPVGPGGTRRRQPRWGRARVGLVAAAAALVVAGTVGGYVAGHSAGTHRMHVASNARLVHVVGGPAAVSGAASVHSSSDGKLVTVTTAGLPLRDGFYEVWLFDPNRGPQGDMVAIGALGDRGRGTFTLPSGIDIRRYNIVNVSAQNYGGGARVVHAQSVLQGSLTQ